MELVTGIIGDVIPAIGEIASAGTSADGEVTVTTTKGDTYVATGGANNSINLTRSNGWSSVPNAWAVALPLGLVAFAAWALWR